MSHFTMMHSQQPQEQFPQLQQIQPVYQFQEIHQVQQQFQQQPQQQQYLPPFSSSFVPILPVLSTDPSPSYYYQDAAAPVPTSISISTSISPTVPLDSALMPPPLLPPPKKRSKATTTAAAEVAQGHGPQDLPGPPRRPRARRAGRPPAAITPAESSLSPEALAKLELRRARNRIAARKCRDNKFHRMDELRSAIAEVKVENAGHQEEIDQLEVRLGQLRRMIASLCLVPALGESVPASLVPGGEGSVPDILQLINVLVVHPTSEDGQAVQASKPQIVITTYRGTAFELGNSPDQLTPVEVIYEDEEGNEVTAPTAATAAGEAAATAALDTTS